MKSIFFITYFFTFSFFLSNIDVVNINGKGNVLDTKIKVPQIITPIQNSIVDSVCQFIWTSSGSRITYELWISDDVNFQQSKQFLVKDTVFTCSLGAETNSYKYCKVRSWNKSKKYSNWSSVITLSHGEIFKQYKEEIIYQRRCDGNCGNCKNPCGRRHN